MRSSDNTDPTRVVIPTGDHGPADPPNHDNNRRSDDINQSSGRRWAAEPGRAGRLQARPNERQPRPRRWAGPRPVVEVFAVQVDQRKPGPHELSGAAPNKLAELYTAVRLQLRYEPAIQTVEVTIQPARRVDSAGVRGGSCTKSPR
jgi:hypothetical protein